MHRTYLGTAFTFCGGAALALITIFALAGSPTNIWSVASFAHLSFLTIIWNWAPTGIVTSGGVLLLGIGLYTWGHRTEVKSY